MDPSGTALLRPDLRPAPPAGPTPDDAVEPRLAELLTHLTECPAPLAVAAVNASCGPEPCETYDEKLGVLAAAMLTVKRAIDLRDRPAAPVTG